MKNIRNKYKKATSTPKGKIIFFSIVALILAGITGGLLYWSAYRKQIIRNQLQDTVLEKSNGLYSLKYDELSLDEMSGFLEVKNLEINYDSTRYRSLVASGEAPPTLLRIKIPTLTVTGVKTPRALLEKEIVGQTVTLNHPVMEIIYTNAGKDSTRKTPTKEVYRQILGDLNLIKLDTVVMYGGMITTADLDSDSKLIELENSFLRLTGITIDSASENDTSKLLYSDQIELRCDMLRWKSKDNLYHYQAEKVDINSRLAALEVKKFMIEPQLPEDAFVRKLPFQADRFDFVFNDISASNIDFSQLLKESFLADTMHIGSANMKIYRDLSIKRDNKNRVGTYPQQVVTDLPIPIELKNLYVRNTFLEYKERSAITRQAGQVQFRDCQLHISNITNQEEKISSNNIMLANVKSSFLGETPLNAEWTFFLGHPKGRFDVKGRLGSIAATKLNKLTVPMGPARLEDGRINSMDFDLHGNDYSMQGTVKLLYEDLKISVLKADDQTKEIDKKTLASIAANFIVKNSNPTRNNDPRIIEVDYERDTNRSIFNLTWKALFKGIKETVGIKK